MKLGEEGATYYSLPPNLQNAENYAMGYAVDRQMKKLMEFYKKMLVWPDIENVDPKYYGYLAASIRALYYSEEYDNETRKEILKDALKTYMFAGTITSEEELLEKLFPDAVFVPWYEYDGEPYHFKIIVPTDPSQETLTRFVSILKRVKAQRSIIDAIETKTYYIDMTVEAGIGLWNHKSMNEKIE